VRIKRGVSKVAEFKSFQESEIDSVCNEEREKFDHLKQEERIEHDNVRNHKNKKKREMVVEFAERLDKLTSQKDIISSIIVKTLKGLVSKSLIHECLPAKYKQKHRIDNAKKQKKNVKIEHNLAPLSALNQPQHEIEEEEQKKKQMMTVTIGPDGRSYIQSENNGEPSNNEQEDILDKPNSLTDTSNKSEITEGAPVENDKDILSFEFSWSFNELRNYLTPLYSKIGDNGRIWFSGSIDINTGKVISQHFGRWK